MDATCVRTCGTESSSESKPGGCGRFLAPAFSQASEGVAEPRAYPAPALKDRAFSFPTVSSSRSFSPISAISCMTSVATQRVFLLLSVPREDHKRFFCFVP